MSNAKFEDYHVNLILADEYPAEYVDYELVRLEKDAIYQAVKQAQGNWIAVKVVKKQWHIDTGIMKNSTEYRVDIECENLRTGR